ncbi:MAG: hypothetical protein ACREXU_05300 [Gammaproteobacteria bacterium]
MSRSSNWIPAIAARAKRSHASNHPCGRDHENLEALRDVPGSSQRWIGHLFPLDPTAFLIRSDADGPTVLCPSPEPENNWTGFAPEPDVLSRSARGYR